MAPGPAPALRCSFAAELRGDPMPGTAAPATGLLLIEQPGPWGRQALVQSRLDPAVGEAIGARGVAVGLRVLLIRRPGRAGAAARPRARAAETRRWALVDCRPGREVTRWGRFAEVEELLHLPLDGSAGTPSYEPCYLICTHGRHDACCAIRGRPAAAALAAQRPGQVWECSHIGGDRFAANLLTLPHGLYYGRADGDRAAEVARAHERGEVFLPLLRGRTTFAPAAQAAQHHTRQVLGELAINALTPLRTVPLGHGRWQVRLAREPRDLLVTVETVAAGPPALLTCSARHPAHPPGFKVIDLREDG